MNPKDIREQYNELKLLLRNSYLYPGWISLRTENLGKQEHSYNSRANPTNGPKLSDIERDKKEIFRH